jgi:predicted amidohydrolase YtcJ
MILQGAEAEGHGGSGAHDRDDQRRIRLVGRTREGSITAGKLADFVVLEKDPHDIDPDQIMNIKVARTVVGGKTVYGG